MNTNEGRFEGKHSEVSEVIIRAYDAVYNGLGFLLNFGAKPEIKRVVLDNEQKKICVDPSESVVGFLGSEL